MEPYPRVPWAMSHLVLYGEPKELNKIQNFVKYGQVGSLLKANSMMSLKIGVKEGIISSETIYSSSNKAPCRQILNFFVKFCSFSVKKILNLLNYCYIHFLFKANFACEIQICYDRMDCHIKIKLSGFFARPCDGKSLFF